MLSQEQQQALLQKTRNNWSRADISAYLTQECGLSLRDAYHERNWALKIIEDEKAKQQAEEAARPPGEKERLEEEYAAEVARKKEEMERERLKKCNPQYLPDETHPEKECESCGDPHFWCDCSCKRTTDIPW